MCALFSSCINLCPDMCTHNVQLVFQMTVRMATCRELADDKEAIQNVRKQYFDMQQSSTPVSILLPWFPGPAKKLKKKATRELYFLIKKYVTMRRDTKISSLDPIDLLIANGDSAEVIVSVSALNLFYSYLLGPFSHTFYRPSWASFLLEL